MSGVKLQAPQTSCYAACVAHGLRERKKAATRRLIAEAARKLFVERGFEAVTVAAVARASDVSDGSVFNYFGNIEVLFFSGMELFEAALLEAVRTRPPGEPALVAFRRFLLERSRQLEDDETAAVLAQAASVLASSAALQAHEREIVSRHARSLAALFAQESDAPADDVEANVVATSLMAVHHAVVIRVRAAAADGQRGTNLAALAPREAKRGFARLELGLADYATRPIPDRPRGAST